MSVRICFYLSLLLFSFLFFSCQPSNAPLGSPLSFFPSTSQLQEGIVNKYYIHYQSNDGFEKSTDILYYAYQLNNQQQLQISVYNPGYEVTRTSTFEFFENEMRLKDRRIFWQGDEYAAQLAYVTFLDWQKDTATFKGVFSYGQGRTQTLEWQQISGQDSIISASPVKIFHRLRKRLYQYDDQDDRQFTDTITEIYAQGLGLFNSTWKMKKGKANIELVKQFHWKDFKAMANSAPKRVAYINPAKRIDRNSNFSPCENSNKIHDYYNGTPHAGLRTGKRGWQKLFQQKGNSSNASKESGYLTFRFVINCEGKTGWFTTEEADLDFQPKEFPPELVQHYFDIIEKVDDWRPVVIRQKAADAYAYLTLKLKDGELIDILP